jgi:hypothetical protein
MFTDPLDTVCFIITGALCTGERESRQIDESLLVSRAAAAGDQPEDDAPLRVKDCEGAVRLLERPATEVGHRNAL